MSQIPQSAPYLSPEEKRELMVKSDWKALAQIVFHWSLIILSFIVVFQWPRPEIILVAVLIIGGQQLACSVLMHDAGHYAVFNNKRVNDFFGQVLGAWPIFQNMVEYRSYHLLHHKRTGLEDDPDILLTRGYPTSPMSMIRKLIRDISGLTGLKATIGLLMMHLGYLEYNLGKKIVRRSQKDRTWQEFFQLAYKRLSGPILINLSLFGILSFFSPWLYLLWIGAYLTSFQFCIRIRSIAEHSVLEDPHNPLKNTRTTYANWLEKLLFAPYNVNYHLEHHMLMTVPSYNLPKMHKMLLKRGFYREGILAKNYWEVILQTFRKKPVPR